MKAKLGKVTAAWPRGETRVLLAGSSRVCGPTGPGARVRRWKPLPGLPAGQTLAPETARSTAFLHFLLLPQPQTDAAWGQAVLRKARGVGWGWGHARNPGSNPEAAGKSRVRCPAPSGPLGGELTLSRRPGARSLAPCRVGLALLSAPPGASMRYVSQLNLVCFQLRAKARARPPRGCLEGMPPDETNINNNNRHYKTK